MLGVVTRRGIAAALVAAAVVASGFGSARASSAAHAVPPGAQPDRSAWTRRSRTFHDGHKKITVLYGGAVNYRDAHGAWQTIDDTLVPSATAGYAYENRADGYTLRLPSDLYAPVQLA